MRLRTLVLSLIPGLAHVHLGRPGLGIFLFFLFAMSLNATLMASLLLPGRQFRLGCALATFGFWLLACTHSVRIAWRTAHSRRAAVLAAALAGDDESRKVTRRSEAGPHA